jgi:hypothetical protein
MEIVIPIAAAGGYHADVVMSVVVELSPNCFESPTLARNPQSLPSFAITHRQGRDRAGKFWKLGMPELVQMENSRQ